MGPTLTAFRDYMNSLSLSFTFDHAIGLFKLNLFLIIILLLYIKLFNKILSKFSSKDLWNGDTSLDIGTRASITGLAFTGGVCTSNKYSISEDFGGLTNVQV